MYTLECFQTMEGPHDRWLFVYKSSEKSQIIQIVRLQSNSCSVNPWECLQATEGAYGRWSSADVVCHELAHQWFGNYVTCKDFDNISGMQPQSIHLQHLQLSHAIHIMLVGQEPAHLHGLFGTHCIAKGDLSSHELGFACCLRGCVAPVVHACYSAACVSDN